MNYRLFIVYERNEIGVSLEKGRISTKTRWLIGEQSLIPKGCAGTNSRLEEAQGRDCGDFSANDLHFYM